MAAFDIGKLYDGRRLTRMMRASVQQNGYLTFPQKVVQLMGLSLEKSLLICPLGEKDLSVTVAAKDAPYGFAIRSSGPYLYVPFRSLLTELGIDFVKNRVIYDIIELNERYEGSPVYKFNRRIIEHEQAEAESEGLAGEEETLAAADDGKEAT